MINSSHETNLIIPKKIHYCRFGRNPKSEEFQKYLDSWKKFCPDYEIIERNEINFDPALSKYCDTMYKAKRWPFVADYLRFWVLYHEGGIYLDTDVEIVKNFDVFLHHKCFLGFQDVFEVNGAIIGAVKHHWFIKSVLDNYNARTKQIVLPRLITPLLKKKGLKYNKNQLIGDIAIYSKEYFYPFAYFESFTPSCVTKNTYAIHWFQAAWLPKIVIWGWFPIVRWAYKLFSFRMKV